ncbi:MAG: hypothetical protein ISQ16_03340 [Candidatus Actinomarina sp.]|nr:hypothetical protein [Candidatus Actinomarina sp.]MDA2946934.1 hypothetical protein [Actinomycetota bacterium]MBL6762930.1 hypothetical protein [Candidatus Actinomarina sp.]MBL6836214.1 hypothetical protein [Candidatus Actinomarina sp.]MDA3008947.1 hypothetical protein [Actinomycetota bacterium]
MSSYEDRMAEKYNFLKKDSNNQNLEESISEEKPSENPRKDVEVPKEGSLLVPLDAWNTVLNQLGNLHEASQQMAEARERAAKAESEADFLREKLKNTRQQLDEVKKKKRFFFF